MIELLKLVGFLLSLYGVYAYFRGEVLVKSNWGWQRLNRYDHPKTFRAIALIYAFIGQLIVWAMVYRFGGG